MYSQVMGRTRFSLSAHMLVALAFSGGYLTAFLWGAVHLSAGCITFGTMTAFLQLVGKVQRPVFDLSRLIPSVVNALTAIDRLLELERLPAEADGDSIFLASTPELELKDVTFRYTPDDRPVFSRFSCRFPAGSCIAIVGETGKGKTTLIRLLLALATPQEGQILLIPAKHPLETNHTVSPQTRKNFVYVPQGNTLFSGTIRDNLLMGNPQASQEAIYQALQTATADFVFHLPDGVDSPLSERGGGKGIDTYSFQAANIDFAYLESDAFLKKCSSLRGSVMLVGPMVARFGKAMISKPGGDKIGRRRLDTHFIGIQNLGADFVYNEERGIYEISAKQLHGSYMLLDEASVTGTANIVMAAVLAKGKTTIYNAACEPYVQQLCRMLNRMGAKIEGIASNLLTIEGVDELHGTEHTILPDMIEVGSFIGMAAMTRSELTIKNVSYENLGIIPDSFRRLGIKMEQWEDDIYVPAQETYQIESFIDGSIMTIADAPWPGLTPDLLSVLLVVATQAKGSVLIHQKMFESRLFFVDKLIDMGAQIILCDPHRAVVIGHDHGFKLRGGNMTSPDIRAGIALLIAAMSADGISRIHNIEQIDRGYQNIEGRLNALGARITRIE